MRYTKDQFDEEFPDDDTCLDKIFQERYGWLTRCPNPECYDEHDTTKFHRLKGRKCYACQWCGYQLHPLSGTIFHKSSTPLRKWFYAIYLFSVSKNGVAAKELERHLGVNYRTAHRIAHQIRKLMAEDGELSGDVEIDETYIGGKHPRKFRHGKKQPVFGVVERNGEVRAKHVKSTGSRVLIPEVLGSVAKGATIYSDEYRVYAALPKHGYSHTTVNHGNLEYVRGRAYTNTIEGFWSQMKRSLDGTYHAVSPKYLQLYVNEFVYRYNRRGQDATVYPDLLERASMHA